MIDYEILVSNDAEVNDGVLLAKLKELGKKDWKVCFDLIPGATKIAILLMREKAGK